MNVLRNTALLLTSIFLALLLAEGILRLYNPFDTRIRGNQITLRTDVVYRMPNRMNPKLAPELVHTRNNIGFRGPDWSPQAEGAVRIFAVGGSTTECFYLSDGYDWPAVMAAQLHLRSATRNSQYVNILNHTDTTQQENTPIPTHSDTTHNVTFWVNNAGLDGHSTFGHRILMQEMLHLYNPHYILYLVGANDVGRSDLGDHVQSGVIPARPTFSVRTLHQLWAHHTEFGALADNLIRAYRARSLGVTHQNVNFESLPYRDVSEEEIAQNLALHRSGYIQAYQQRLTLLVEETLQYGIQPILLTQPMPYGPAIDPETGIDLARIEVRSGSGYQRWREVELYNEVTRNVAAQFDLMLIDLEQELPKNTRFYYDMIHFTDEGAQQIGEIVAKRLLDLLNTP
jgi:lysophospholipase L1-like esterase